MVKLLGLWGVVCVLSFLQRAPRDIEELSELMSMFTLILLWYGKVVEMSLGWRTSLVYIMQKHL